MPPLQRSLEPGFSPRQVPGPDSFTDTLDAPLLNLQTPDLSPSDNSPAKVLSVPGASAWMVARRTRGPECKVVFWSRSSCWNACWNASWNAPPRSPSPSHRLPLVGDPVHPRRNNKGSGLIAEDHKRRAGEDAAQPRWRLRQVQEAGADGRGTGAEPRLGEKEGAMPQSRQLFLCAQDLCRKQMHPSPCTGSPAPRA
jgi:hypothetical protein